jgi:hypothetical protein
MISTLKFVLPLALAVVSAVPTTSQTTTTLTLNVSAYGFACGPGFAGQVDCYNVPFTNGGSLWFDTYAKADFVQLSAAGPVNGTSSALVTSTGGYSSSGSPSTNVTNFAFTGIDKVTNKSFSGSGSIYYHIVHTRSGNKAVLDSGTLSVTE